MTERRLVIDRIEGKMAVVEIDGMTMDWPVSLLPESAREGQVFALRLDPVEEADCEPNQADSPMDIQL